MRAHDLGSKNVVIWGTGREGRAAADFLRRAHPDITLTFVDEAPEAPLLPTGGEGFGVRWGHGNNSSPQPSNETIIRHPATIVAALDKADVVIKSPGVSLYHPLIENLKAKGTPVTSLLNLWLAEPRAATVIGVAGTKGKSTTAALLAHTLERLGKKTVFAGNIGVPITEAPEDGADYIVAEISSYQAADIEGECALGVLTSLYPEHLDWHHSLGAYYRDKLNLLKHSGTAVINAEAMETLKQYALELNEPVLFNHPSGFHAEDGQIYEGEQLIGTLANRHLSRAYNLSNVCAVLTVLRQLGFDPIAALPMMEDFEGLPHRQQELGEKDGVLYVDDSISTTPQSAIAALEAHKGRPVTLIAGGFDRGIDYAPLADYVTAKKVNAVVCIGPSGRRIFELLKNSGFENVFSANSMAEAAALAKQHTPKGGAILLSPAAPSYGLFHDFAERGEAFAMECGFLKS